jgi:membrane fusion protein (multidrug efflux system)
LCYAKKGRRAPTNCRRAREITANFKESQLDRMRPGRKVDVAIDAYPGLKLTGHVDSIQLGSGSYFTAFPPDNATGNYAKIVQRIQVKTLIPDEDESDETAGE